MADAPENQSVFANDPHLQTINISLEQYTLQSVCRQRGVTMQYLQNTSERAFLTDNSKFVHLFSRTKQTPWAQTWLEETFAKHCPHLLNAVSEANGIFGELQQGLQTMPETPKETGMPQV